MRYKIIQAKVNVFHVKYKWLFFWVYINECYGPNMCLPKNFKSVDEAERAVRSLCEEKAVAKKYPKTVVYSTMYC